jgi:hypothetical protein
VPRQFDVSSVTFVNFGLNSRQFDVTLKGKFSGENDSDPIELEDKGEAEDLEVIRYILSKLPAAYGNNTPVAFSLTLDDRGEIIVPHATMIAAAVAELISINNASATKLQALPGIGPATAALIIAKRPFSNVDELETVDGIGPAKLRDIKPLVTVS